MAAPQQLLAQQAIIKDEIVSHNRPLQNQQPPTKLYNQPLVGEPEQSSSGRRGSSVISRSHSPARGVRTIRTVANSKAETVPTQSPVEQLQTNMTANSDSTVLP